MWAENMDKIDIKERLASATDERVLNPKAYGGLGSDGREKTASTPMFNDKGEINAYDKSEAVSNQMKFASLKDRYNKTGSFYTPAEKERIMEAGLSGSPEDRQRFGSEMIPLILERLDYEGFCRQVLKTHEVAQGQIISYEKDINVAALKINSDGQTIETVVAGNRIFPSEFWVTAFPKIGMEEIAKRQFDVVDRAHDKALFQIMLEEDRNCLRQLYAASTIENSQISITSTVNKSVLESIQYEVERHRLPLEKFIMNRQELGDIKKNVNAIDYDPVTSRDLLLTGVFGSIWGVKIFIGAGRDENGQHNASVPEGVIFGVTEGRYLGAMPIRIALTMLPADQFITGKFQYGWLFGEMIGQVINNPRSCAIGIKSSATLPSWLTE